MKNVLLTADNRKNIILDARSSWAQGKKAPAQSPFMSALVSNVPTRIYLEACNLFSAVLQDCYSDAADRELVAEGTFTQAEIEAFPSYAARQFRLASYEKEIAA